MSEKRSLILLFLLAGLFMLLGYLLNIVTGSVWAGYGLTIAIIIICMLFFGYRRRHYVLAQNAHNAYLRKQFDIAYGLYEKALSLPKCPEEIKVVYAYKLLAQGHTQKAQQVAATIQTDILNKDGIFNFKVVKGLMLYKEDKLDDAIALYEELTQESDAEQLWETYGMLLNLNEQYEKARDYSIAALEKYPNNNIIKENLATSYFYLFEDKKARKLYKSLITADVHYPEPYYYYARIAYLDERYNLALKYIEMAETKTPAALSNITLDVVVDLKNDIEAELDRLEAEFDADAQASVDTDVNADTDDDADAHTTADTDADAHAHASADTDADAHAHALPIQMLMPCSCFCRCRC
ncbi:tetratricopeptide repeat protein [Candidatus Epulonipiscium viviparus]|uniref:tetratricopeptide repeat protein n=1 Tax=Candidatus Epulonipiscium viviparus TaxID=420336 RepID=UPI0027381466|nr:hypothetical protein [Candidatus Epulopiscium viviparus]